MNKDYNHFSTHWNWKDSGKEKEWRKWEKTALYWNSLLPDGSRDCRLIREGRVENICWALWATRGDPHTSHPREWQNPHPHHPSNPWHTHTQSSFPLLGCKAGPSTPYLHSSPHSCSTPLLFFLHISQTQTCRKAQIKHRAIVSWRIGFT